AGGGGCPHRSLLLQNNRYSLPPLVGMARLMRSVLAALRRRTFPPWWRSAFVTLRGLSRSRFVLLRARRALRTRLVPRGTEILSPRRTELPRGTIVRRTIVGWAAFIRASIPGSIVRRIITRIRRIAFVGRRERTVP